MEVAGCELPEDRRYDLEHEVWWKPEPDGESVRVGVMATVGAFAGAFREVVYRPVTGVLRRGQSVAAADSVRTTAAIRLPADGAVVERNPALSTRPRLLNDEPYSAGWVVRVRPEPRADARPNLETAAEIAERLAEEVRRRRIRCWPQTPDVELAEVGSECSAVLARLNEEMARREPDEAVLLVTDDPTSPIEMVRWSDQTGFPLLAQRREGDVYRFLIRRVAHPVPRRPRR